MLGVDRQFLTGLGRAFFGSLIFGLPILMTMEMWGLGAYLHPTRLIAFLVISLPLLVGLSWFGGFESNRGNLPRVLADALVAIVVATVSSLWRP